MFKEYKEIADSVGWSGAAGFTDDVRSAFLKYCETYSKKAPEWVVEKFLRIRELKGKADAKAIGDKLEVDDINKEGSKV